MRPAVGLACSLALSLAPSLASGQTSPSPSEEPVAEATVVGPSRQEQSLLDTPRAVSSDGISSARRALARDVGERLDELPGVYVQRTTSASAAPVIRGLQGQRALLLFDGLRLNDSLTKVGGNALLTLIDPAIVRQVEVVRGPASVLYGSDALGGVVLVSPIDAQPREDGEAEGSAEAVLRAASAERSIGFQTFVEGEAGPVGLLLGGSTGLTGRLMAGGSLGEQLYSGYGDRALSARAVALPARGQRLGVAFHTSALTGAPRPDTSTAGDVRVFRLQQREVGYATWRLSAGAFTLNARAGAIVRSEYRDRYREARLDVERDQVLTWVGGVQAGARVGGARLTAGVEASLDDVQSGTTTYRAGRAPQTARGRYVDGSTYLTGGLYGLWQQRLGARFLVEAGARLALVRATAPVDGTTEAMEHTELAPVASVGARYLVTEGVSVVANLLSGFRAPNLDDFQALGSGARSYDVPNANLGSERSWTAEAGARWVRGGFSGSLFVFGSALTGLVVRVPSSFDGMTMIDGRRVFTRENASEATLLGVEFDLAYRARSGLYAAVSATYTQGDATFPNESGQTVTEPMAKLPPALGRLSAGWRGTRGWLDVVLSGGLPQARLATSDREDVRLCPSGPASCEEVPGWASMTVRGGWALTPSVTLGAAVENVWDGGYTTYGSGLPSPGINVVGMLRVRSR